MKVIRQDLNEPDNFVIISIKKNTLLYKNDSLIEKIYCTPEIKNCSNSYLIKKRRGNN